ncbi:MAG: type IV pilus secretin PilQ [Gammaproteobacteria bacterium]|nr:type IV pilus secretin PilQ [Gammaproteobacteria bacterium]
MQLVRTMRTPPAGTARRSGRETWLARTGLLLFLALVAHGAWAAEPVSLQAVSSASLPRDRVQIVLKMSGPAPKPLSFTIDNPATIALDFMGVQDALPKRSQAIGVGAVRSIDTVQANGRTRVVLNLVQMVPYETRVEGNEVYITLHGQPLAATAKATTSAATAGNSITNIDFRRTMTGAGRVVVTVSNPAATINTREENGKILVDFYNTSLPASLERRLDVTDFATPVKTIDTRVQGNNVHMTVTPAGGFEDFAYQADKTFTLEVKPVTAEQQQAQQKKFPYTGKRLSLNFQNIDVRSVLQLLADFTGLNIVVSDSVTGTITLRLHNVPWDQAMAIILKTKGLGERKVGNVVMIAPEAELAAREKQELEARKQLTKLEPLQATFMQVNYAKASDIAKLLKSKKNSLLSTRGSVTVDERTNTLLVQDTPSRLEQIRKLVARLDIPVRQVLIESRIVVANNNFARNLGVRFGLSKATRQPSSTNEFAIAGGTQPGTNTFPSSTAFPTGGQPEGMIVSLPAVAGTPSDISAVASLGLAVGKIGNHLLQLELSAMEFEGQGEIISSPRVVTANQKQAVIESGVEIPYQQATSSGATAVSFKKAVLSLKVTPQITPDKHINMDLVVSQDDVGQIFQGVPSINTQEVTTQVLVNNGETVVLGGIYQQTKNNNIQKVPFFGDIPGLGWLFRNKVNQNDKKELLVFVTPKILNQSLTVGY